MIEIRDLKTGYGDFEVLKGIDLQFSESEFCAVLGPNGAGKSTIFSTLVGLLKYTGTIKLENKDLLEWPSLKLARKIAVIPQEMNLQFDYTVTDLVLMGRFPYLKNLKDYSKNDHEIVESILDQLDIYEHKNKLYSNLSGGEKQRVSIARALAQKTDILLMDEGLAGLDINHQLEIMKILKKINIEEGKLIIFVSHNINLASDYSERIIMLKNGRIFRDGNPEQVIDPSILKDLYDTELIVVTNPVSGRPNLVYPGF